MTQIGLFFRVAPDWVDGDPHAEAAWVFHVEHPDVYRALRRFALEARRSGRERLGIGMLFERVRWYTSVEGGVEFKLNNNHRATFARLLMEREPELAGFFETRARRPVA